MQPEDVTGEQVVLDDAPVLGPEPGDDVVVAIVDHRVPARGFARDKYGADLALITDAGTCRTIVPFSDRRLRLSVADGLLVLWSRLATEIS